MPIPTGSTGDGEAKAVGQPPGIELMPPQPPLHPCASQESCAHHVVSIMAPSGHLHLIHCDLLGRETWDVEALDDLGLAFSETE